MSNIPYTYLIGWRDLQTYYYGVRYSRKCHPNDLFVSYFTSSKIVSDFILKHGNPDIIQVRKIFPTGQQARSWEYRVLRKIKAVKRPDFLNRNDRPAPAALIGRSMIGTKSMLKGENRTDRQKDGSRKRLLKVIGKPSKRRQHIEILGVQYSSVTEAMKELKISFGIIKFVREEEISSFSSIDEIKEFVWLRRSDKLKNRRVSIETRKKISVSSMGKIGTRKNAKVTDESRERISKALKGKKQTIVKCPHCDVCGGVNTMKRWHFENCKQ